MQTTDSTARTVTAAARTRRGAEFIDSLRCRFRRPCLRGRRGHLAVGPDGTVFEVFFLPDGDGSLQRVDGEPASLERSRPVCSTDCNEDAGLADFQAAEPMRNGDEVNGIFLMDLKRDFADF